MQKGQETRTEAKDELPTNVRIREQDHWNVVVKKQIRRGKKGSHEPLATDGWTGAFVLNPRKRHLKVDRGLVTVCGVRDGSMHGFFENSAEDGTAKQDRKKRGRGAQGKENAVSDDPMMREAPPEWLLSALLELKQAPVDRKLSSQPSKDHAGVTVQPMTDERGEVERPSQHPNTPPKPSSAQPNSSPLPDHPFTYTCKCSSCLTAMIPVPFQYSQR